MIHLYLVMVFSFITWRKTPLNQVTLSTPKTLFLHVGVGPECVQQGEHGKSTEVPEEEKYAAKTFFAEVWSAA